MVQSLEQYMAEAARAYEPAKTAINTQLSGLEGNYKTGEDKINRDFNQQQAGIERQRNIAAESASMQAAGSGGSFGGKANLANRKYYDQSFIPAQTQLNTNKSNSLEALRQDIENQRTNLNSQLANLEAQGNQQATQQYWAALEAEKEREAQLQRQREAQAAQYAAERRMMEAYKNQGIGRTPAWDFGNGYQLLDNNGRAVYMRNGQQINAGQFLMGTGMRGANWNLWNDVWNNGVSTNGVGSDTVSAFSGGFNAANNILKNGSKYAYLLNQW